MAVTIVNPTAPFRPIPAPAIAFGKARVLFWLMTLYKLSYVTTCVSEGAFFHHETQDNFHVSLNGIRLLIHRLLVSS